MPKLSADDWPAFNKPAAFLRCEECSAIFTRDDDGNTWIRTRFLTGNVLVGRSGRQDAIAFAGDIYGDWVRHGWHPELFVVPVDLEGDALLQWMLDRDLITVTGGPYKDGAC